MLIGEVIVDEVAVDEMNQTQLKRKYLNIYEMLILKYIPSS
jgi:hypothetical protein